RRFGCAGARRCDRPAIRSRCRCGLSVALAPVPARLRRLWLAMSKTTTELGKNAVAALAMLGVVMLATRGIEIKPLSLTDRQLRLVQTAAKAVPVQRRDEFLQRLAAQLTSQPSDAAVQAALNAQLDALTHVFLCDSANNGEDTDEETLSQP